MYDRLFKQARNHLLKDLKAQHRAKIESGDDNGWRQGVRNTLKRFAAAAVSETTKSKRGLLRELVGELVVLTRDHQDEKVKIWTANWNKALKSEEGKGETHMLPLTRDDTAQRISNTLERNGFPGKLPDHRLLWKGGYASIKYCPEIIPLSEGTVARLNWVRQNPKSAKTDRYNPKAYFMVMLDRLLELQGTGRVSQSVNRSAKTQ